MARTKKSTTLSALREWAEAGYSLIPIGQSDFPFEEHEAKLFRALGMYFIEQAVADHQDSPTERWRTYRSGVYLAFILAHNGFPDLEREIWDLGTTYASADLQWDHFVVFVDKDEYRFESWNQLTLNPHFEEYEYCRNIAGALLMDMDGRLEVLSLEERRFIARRVVDRLEGKVMKGTSKEVLRYAKKLVAKPDEAILDDPGR